MLQANLLAFHLISIVCWFAGLLYSGRLLIYALDAQNLPQSQRTILQEQYRLMKRRLWYGITTPAMLATIVLGIVLMMRTPVHHLPWFMLKMTLVIALLGYHVCCQLLISQQARGVYRFTSRQLRIWNEIGTVLLIGIVLLVKHRDIGASLLTTAISCLVIGGLFLLVRRAKPPKKNTSC